MSTSTFWALRSGGWYTSVPAVLVRRRGGRTGLASAGTLTGRVPEQTLALAPTECQRRGTLHHPRGPTDRIGRWTSTRSGGCSPTTASGCSPARSSWPTTTRCAPRPRCVVRRRAEQASPPRSPRPTLRLRAVAKFGDDAARMYFTPDGLEQATRRPGRHPPRRPAAAASTGTAHRPRLRHRRRPGRRGPGRAHRRRGRPRPGPGRGRGGQPRRARPARRGDGRRRDRRRHQPLRRGLRRPGPAHGAGPHLRRRRLDPPWPFVESTCCAATSCVKVAPGIPHDLVPAGVEAEWVSDRGEVKEAALWSGRLATTARRATVIGDSGLATLTDEDDPGAGGPVPVGRLPLRARRRRDPGRPGHRGGRRGGRRAGRRAHRLRHLRRVVPDAVRARLPVLEELPYREKPLRAALRERGIGPLTIKKRGVDVVPEQLRKRLDLRGTTRRRSC